MVDIIHAEGMLAFHHPRQWLAKRQGDPCASLIAEKSAVGLYHSPLLLGRMPRREHGRLLGRQPQWN
ncbi:MAG: hypothetical protein ACLGSD_08615 [Acidobacteriota bacterium]